MLVKSIIRNNLYLFVIFLFLFVLNLLFPRQSDDFDAMFASKNGLSSAIGSYMGWNGRIGELLHVSFVGGFHPYLFDLINAIVGTLFIFMFFMLIFARTPKNSFDISCIALSILIIMYTLPFGADFFWGSGSLNYLWGLLFITIFLIPYRFYYDAILCNGGGYKPKLGVLFLPFLFLSFIAGMASEQIGFICILSLLFLSVCYWKYKFPFWYLFGLLFFILGWLCLYFSPGHEARAYYDVSHGGIYLSVGEIFSLDFSDKLMRLYITLKKFYTKTFTILSLFVWSIFTYDVLRARYSKYAVALIYIFGVIIVIILGKNFWMANYVFVFSFFLNRALKKDSSYIAALILLILFMICALITIQFPALPFRARLGDGLLLIAIIVILFAKYCNAILFRNIVVSISIIYGLYVLSAFIHYRLNWNNLLVYIQNQKQNGNYHIEIDKKIFDSYYRGFTDWLNPDYDASSWPNPVYSKVFGVESFIAK